MEQLENWLKENKAINTYSWNHYYINMYFDFVHNDWICSSHKAHKYPSKIIKSQDKLNCGCSDEKHIINWNYRDDPDESYEPLEKNKSITINVSEKKWICPQGHMDHIDTPIFRSYDTFICSNCKKQYQFAPTIEIPKNLMSKLEERMSSFKS